MNEKLITFIENSFLSPIINLEGITDISYNGVSIFYVHNVLGRQKADFQVKSDKVLDVCSGSGIVGILQ